MKYGMILLPIIVALQLTFNVVLGVVWIAPGSAQEIPCGITVDSRDISGFEPDKAVSFLKTVKRNNTPIKKEIILTDGVKEWSLTTRDFDFSYDYQQTIDEVVAKIEENKGPYRIIDLLKLQAKPIDMPIVLSWDEDKLQNLLQSINDEIYSPAQDAALDFRDNEIFITVEKMGEEVAYEETVQQILKSIQSNNTEPVSIVKKNVSVDVGIEDLGTFNSILSLFVTDLNSNHNRSINIQRAAELIDGTVLMPGEVFSFNTRVGERNRDSGFTYAPVIIGNQMVDDIGGGICQVASTLYNATIRAELPVIERHPHSINVKYVPNGRDAAIVYGLMDLRFKNNRLNPIGISSKVEDNQLVVAILGNKADKTED